MPDDIIKALIKGDEGKVKIYLMRPFGHISAKDAEKGLVSEIIGFDGFFLKISYERKTTDGNDWLEYANIPIGNILGIVPN